MGKKKKQEKQEKLEKQARLGKQEKPEKQKKQKKQKKQEKLEKQKKQEKRNKQETPEVQKRQEMPEMRKEKPETREKAEKKPIKKAAKQQEKTTHTAAEHFRVLGDENRLRILMLLGDGELCAGDILKSLSIVQSTLSHHMKVLVESGIVKCRKQGKWSYYSVDQEMRERIAGFTEQWPQESK